MKVRELIEELSKMNPEGDVWFFDGDWTEHPCNYVTSWTEQPKWPRSIRSDGELVMEKFETPRVLLS